MINSIKTLTTLTVLCGMVVLFVLTMGDVASGPDAPHPVNPPAHSFDLSSSSPIDPGHRAQAIGAGLDHLEDAR